MRFRRPDGGVPDREDLRRETARLMKAISALVEHERNYIPIRVPIPPLPRYSRLGVLLLHGFTSSLKTVEGLVPHLERAGIPCRMPVLRGHGTRWEDLQGVTARDWYADAEAALQELSAEVDAVVVVGLSMGGLVALELAMNHPRRVGAVVTVAAALRFKDPLSRLTPVMAKVVRSWPSPESFNDPTLRSRCENYPRFTTDAFASLYDYSQQIEARLGEVRAPICVLQSKRDQVVAPVSANLIYEKVASEHREIHWFQRSGHEMMQDLEAPTVFDSIMKYLAKLRKEPN
jgi:carboxylesterase